MKKVLLLALAGSIMLAGNCHAAGNVTVTDKTICIAPGDDSGHFYAKIENDGDEPVGVDNGTYPSRIILNPGEYTYINEFLWDSAIKNQTIGDIKFSIEATDRGTEAARIPCEASFEINGSDSYDNYIHITVTNDDSETRSGYYLVAALLDTAGNLVYVDTNQYENVGLHSGSTATFSLYIDRDNINYFESNGIQIGSVDAIVYYRAD